ncbi:phosphopantetheine-binding protein [Paenibacillus aceti]|uniref:Acyl carrier protein n=1 Tax=Paenibacillus aceti TaxID=1820010 RepID=A0ABQ1VQQ0_9BACL|nr:phosphopantetheine-binding protein [Paenibacillus aceti]GGF90548.1 acyl carrier protein [Paenibacillus aceti]
MSRTEIMDKLKELITDSLEHSLPAEIHEADRIYEDLNIDSIMVLQLVVYIEEEFQVDVPEEDVDPAVFQTLGSLVTFIEELQANAA